MRFPLFIFFASISGWCRKETVTNDLGQEISWWVCIQSWLPCHPWPGHVLKLWVVSSSSPCLWTCWSALLCFWQHACKLTGIGKSTYWWILCYSCLFYCSFLLPWLIQRVNFSQIRNHTLVFTSCSCIQGELWDPLVGCVANMHCSALELTGIHVCGHLSPLMVWVCLGPRELLF